MQKWQKLLKILEVTINYQPGILTEVELSRVETEMHLILPADYKGFCQIFGSGIFGDFIAIRCPSSDLFSRSNLATKSIKEQIREYPSKNHEWDRELESLLDSALMFGHDDRGNILFWDLRSYKESDRSYDIYWAKVDEFDDNIYKIGRSFFDFVCDFCLGMKAFELLPEELWPLPKDIGLKFTSYSRRYALS
ncbi:SMI1/KNR4 family protein [Microcoleus sp. F6_C2]